MFISELSGAACTTMEALEGARGEAERLLRETFAALRLAVGRREAELMATLERKADHKRRMLGEAPGSIVWHADWSSFSFDVSTLKMRKF